jgi:hypothetical protein
MNQAKQQQLQQRRSNSLYQVGAILVSGFLVCLAIFYVTGTLGSIYRGTINLIPSLPKYQSLGETKDYESLNGIFDSQPQISYGKDVKYLFIEFGDFDCADCAKFHGYGNTNGLSSYDKFKMDFLKSGKVDYMFIDLWTLNSVEKHNSAYCVAEQNASEYFSYRERLYQDFGKEFNLKSAVSNIRPLTFDNKKFNDCYISEKYKTRVSSLTSFTKNILNIPTAPAFSIYKVERQNITGIDGKKRVQKSYSKVVDISGVSDYDLLFKPTIEDAITK